MLSGKVGDVIYSVTRNPDGTFRQQISANPAQRDNPNTEAQARARLTMATIERAMFTFRDLMGTGFEGVDMGTNSVSKFSEVNYNLIKNGIEDGWIHGTPDAVRVDLPTKGSVVPRDGEFIISQGSLRPIRGFNGSRTEGSRVDLDYRVVSLLNYDTLKAALHETDVNIGDQIAGFYFGIGQQPSQSFIVWFTMWTDAGMPATTKITPTTWNKYVKFNSNVPFEAYYDPSDKFVHLRISGLENWGLKGWGCTGYRRRAIVNGTVKYSTQQMQCRYDLPWRELQWNYVNKVKQSWLT